MLGLSSYRVSFDGWQMGNWMICDCCIIPADPSARAGSTSIYQAYPEGTNERAISHQPERCCSQLAIWWWKNKCRLTNLNVTSIKYQCIESSRVWCLFHSAEDLHPSRIIRAAMLQETGTRRCWSTASMLNAWVVFFCSTMMYVSTGVNCVDMLLMASCAWPVCFPLQAE